MLNVTSEISRTLPKGAPARHLADAPILYAYGCALLESDMGECFQYKIVNLETGRTETLSRRKTPLAPREIEKIAERIRDSSVAGPARLEAERHYGERISYNKCREILYALFRQILPEYGYAARREQISLADGILKTIQNRGVILAEAEVGTGKTLAYLAAAVIAKRGRLNDFWNKAYYPKMSYVDMANMPIVVATSSIALQKAIVTDYIPELSRILMENGIIKAPLTAVLRKGREHYVCEYNLRSRLRYEHNEQNKEILRELLSPKAPIDLADTDGLDPYTKRKIAVPGRCDGKCPRRSACAYLRFRERAMEGAIDIQVVNHNYFLADALRRANDKRPLLQNYQTVIIDEAHKFLAAARSMYGAELSCFALPELKDRVYDLRFKHESAQKLARKTVKKLADESKRLFKDFEAGCQDENADDETTRFTATIGTDAARHLRNLRDISDRLYELLVSEPPAGSDEGRLSQILWEMASVREQLAALARHKGNICWLEKPNVNVTPGTEQETLLCAIPADLDARLHRDLWSKGVPAILTSGTLSAGGDFSHIKQTLGLGRLQNRLSETSKPSPFSHRDNALLYISENMPFPDNKNREYIGAVANEIEKLILASRGHAAILFTSYKAMDMVWERLKQRGIPFPLFRLDKGGVREIERFKRSEGGVLFASGALWEGIDIPGDALSLLVIVKLPFQAPDPIGEYEQTLYKDMLAYKTKVVVPEMLIKLKQGHGRLIRSETDTGVVAILDSRASLTGAYRECVLAALQECPVTARIADVENFIRAKKTPEYFK
ncbi:MAG: ATP-dependent DNA helicase [Gracilibacteraceae bacterium]|jgi:ATP-dependent DNA helicase DinG|nr:ATP-dependent DNA helicase [Gracilibacteraceae bacterium]